jgi:hypothetical protein
VVSVSQPLATPFGAQTAAARALIQTHAAVAAVAAAATLQAATAAAPATQATTPAATAAVGVMAEAVVAGTKLKIRCRILSKLNRHL